MNDVAHSSAAPRAPRSALSVTLMLLGLSALFGGAQAAEGDLKALFLGDKGHHDPAKRFAWISAPLAKAGIAATYTENLADLTPENLAKYDALMVYANIKAVSADQERAIIDYVNNGHGFVPIHCASACFGDSKPLVALIGGRFKSHGSGIVTPLIIKPGHALLQNFTGYTSWDETYVHADHNDQGRTVLAVREAIGEGGNVREPWIWVRDQGKGRVFYTASGHDERTWSTSGFQDLIARGTAWAAGAKGEPVLARLTAPPERTPLRFEPRPTVQNYEKRKPYPQYQLPLTAAEAQPYAKVEPEFKLELFAGEPDIVKPIAFTWDNRGRLFVLQSVDYPSTFTEQWQGHDRIILCEDTKGTGKADKFTVFAEGLNIATGLTFVNGGLLVSQAPNLLFFKDTDGDDKADVKEIVMGGWSKRDTHAGPSNLRYGLDNQVYGSVGYSGFAGENDGRKVEFRQGIWRMNREFKGLEFLGQYSNNTWGLGFNEEGELFGSTANNAHHFYTPIPLPYVAGIKGLEKDKRITASFKMDAHYAAHPLTERIRQVDVLGGYSATGGQALYTARNFPEKYWNRAALVNEPTMHLLHQGFFKRDGSGWIEDGDGGNLVASSDEWFAPVHAEVGPDGAVWVADWYNFIIQHNPTPKVSNGGFDAKTGNGGAHENPLRDYERGRIYRVVWTGAKPSPVKALDAKDPAQLVKALANDNQFWRLTAQRLLIERKQLDVVPALISAAKDQAVDKLGLNVGVIHALWTLHGLGALEGSNAEALAVAVAALKHPAAGVRRNAVQMLPKTVASTEAILAAGLLTDRELNVQLAAILAVSALPAVPNIGDLIFARSQDPKIQGDKWLPSALKIAAARHAGSYLTAELKAGTKLDPAQKGVGDTERVIARQAATVLSQADQADLLALLEGANPVLAGAILDGFTAGWFDGKVAQTVSEREKAVFVTLATKLDEGNQRRLGLLAERWGIQAGLPGIAGQVTKPTAPVATAKPLSPEEQKRFDSGKNIYLTMCIACHQPDGQGLAAVAPPVAGSEWVTGSEERLVRIILHGVKGPIKAAGKTFNLEMPAFKDALDDAGLADLLTYMRKEWGNDAPAVDAMKVRGIRRLEDRKEPWTVLELEKIK